MKRHKWKNPFVFSGIAECVNCGTTREVIASIGIKYHRELKTHVRPDGMRFTGRVPLCDAEMKKLSRPILTELGNRQKGKPLFTETKWYQTWS